MKKIMRKTITICDRCKTEINEKRFLMFECPVCRKECCSNCDARDVFDPIPHVCKICAKIPRVEKYLTILKDDYWSGLKEAKEKLRAMKIYRSKKEKQ